MKTASMTSSEHLTNKFILNPNTIMQPDAEFSIITGRLGEE